MQMSDRSASSSSKESSNLEFSSSPEAASLDIGSAGPTEEGPVGETTLSETGSKQRAHPGGGAPENKPVYAISVAADLVNMHPQTLRQYERRGLLQPQREGKNRLYSQKDIDRILYIQQLTQDLGVNLAGVEEISRLQLELERQKQKMQSEIQRLHHQISDLEDRMDEETNGEVLEDG